MELLFRCALIDSLAMHAVINTRTLPFAQGSEPANLLYDHLQLSGISQRILNDLVACHQDVLAQVLVILLREVYPAVFDYPAGLLRELDDAAF